MEAGEALHGSRGVVDVFLIFSNLRFFPFFDFSKNCEKMGRLLLAGAGSQVDPLPDQHTRPAGDVKRFSQICESFLRKLSKLKKAKEGRKKEKTLKH